MKIKKARKHLRNTWWVVIILVCIITILRFTFFSNIREVPKSSSILVEAKEDFISSKTTTCDTQTTQTTHTTHTTQTTTFNVTTSTVYDFGESTCTYDNWEEDDYVEYSCNNLSQINYYSNTEQRIEAAMEYFISNGFTPEAAAGVIGNIAVESSYNPNVTSSLGYIGLCQWNSSECGGYWWFDVANWATSNGYDSYSFEAQVRAIIECPSRGLLDDESLEELKGITNVSQATEYFAINYEGCIGGEDYSEYYNLGCTYQQLNLRKSESWIAYEMYCSGFSIEYNGEKPYNF